MSARMTFHVSGFGGVYRDQFFHLFGVDYEAWMRSNLGSTDFTSSPREDLFNSMENIVRSAVCKQLSRDYRQEVICQCLSVCLFKPIFKHSIVLYAGVTCFTSWI